MRSRPPHACGSFYHVFLRGNAKQAIFRDGEDREILETCVTRAIEYYHCEIHAYCWMTNHLHLLFRAGVQPIHKTVHHFSTQYARQFNLKYDMVGHVFQGRHGRRLIESDEHLLQAVRYVHRNPLEANLIDDLQQYNWSSYPGYAAMERTKFTQTEFVLKLFNRDRHIARRMLIAFTLDDGFPKSVSPWSTWQEIVTAACYRFGITPADLCGSDAHRRCTGARRWVADAALAAELGSMTWVARRLGRSPAALSKSMKAGKQK